MIGRFLMSSTPLDDFLSDAGASAALGERLERIGLAGSICGLLLVAGLVAFLAAVHRGSAREVVVVVRIARVAGVFVLIGASIEVAGVASVSGSNWFGALGDSSAPMIRLLAGVLIVLGLFPDAHPDTQCGDLHQLAESADGGAEHPVMSGHTIQDAHELAPVHWNPAVASAFGLAGAGVGLLSFGFDGHTVSKGPRVVHAAVNLVHVTAGGVWFGGIVGLVVVAFMRRRSDAAVSPLVVRFSSIATLALIAVALAGTLMSLMITDGYGDFTDTPWGRILLVKVGAVLVAAGIGAYNHFVMVPAIDRDPADPATATLVRRTMTAEALVLLSVVILTVFLTTASTN